jgi:hypothetical protein
MNARNTARTGDVALLWLIPSLCIILPLFMTSQEMWLGGIVATCVLLLFGLAYQRRHARIERIVSEYLKIFREGNYTNGLDTLLNSGVCELHNRFELNEVCRKIRKREKRADDPLQVGDLTRRKVFKFLKWCHKHNKNISSSSDTLVLILEFEGEIPNE